VVKTDMKMIEVVGSDRKATTIDKITARNAASQRGSLNQSERLTVDFAFPL
jgi:hypothetical protein